jgi:hypothetical protein
MTTPNRRTGIHSCEPHTFQVSKFLFYTTLSGYRFIASNDKVLTNNGLEGIWKEIVAA